MIFAPKVSQSFNYNINCEVMRRNRPICVNVKGIGYVLSHSVYLVGKPNAVDKSAKTEVGFGTIFVNEVKDINLMVLGWYLLFSLAYPGTVRCAKETFHIFIFGSLRIFTLKNIIR